MESVETKKDLVISATRKLFSFLDKCVPCEIQFDCTDIGAAGLAERMSRVSEAFKKLDGQ